MDPSEPAAPALAASEPAGAEALLRRCFGARNVLRLPVALQMVRGYGGHVVVDPSTSFNGLEPGAEASEGDVRAWSETLVCLRDRGHLRVPPEDLDVSGAVRDGAFDPRSALGVVEMAGRVLAFAAPSSILAQGYKATSTLGRRENGLFSLADFEATGGVPGDTLQRHLHSLVAGGEDASQGLLGATGDEVLRLLADPRVSIFRLLPKAR